MTTAPKAPRGTKKARTPRKAATKSTVRKASGRSSAEKRSAEASPRPNARSREAGGKAGSGAKRAAVRVYCQGLGDCILVKVKRKRGDDFKLLIDCGVVLGTEDAASIMTRVVESIVEETKENSGDAKGKIDVLAITHEHWDHLSAFNQAADSFAKLAVGSVWVAWTEDPHDDLAKQLKEELGKAEKALAACATAFHATGDGATADMLADITQTAFGTAASSSTSTKAAFDKAKAMAKVTICRPTQDPFEIPDANARLYVLGPPHDPKLIRKINPSTHSPETYGIVVNGEAALPLGVLSALNSRMEASEDKQAPFHQRVTIPLGPNGRPWWFDDSRTVNTDDWKKIDGFLGEYYYGRDEWRRIDGDWLGPASELALALQSYTNNTSLVLALELGDVGRGDVLLFAADAQVGNWESWQAWQWQKDGNKVTGPDLLKRTIFYKVGHHGSHNATLKEHGVEQMDALKTAIIPVDESEALKKRWGRMPLPDLIKALETQAPGRVLRTDRKPATPQMIS
jgi:Metallo-beta-lactamase superfamily